MARPPAVVFHRLSATAALAATLLLGLPTSAARAQDERVLFGVEGDLFFPLSSPELEAYYPGAAVSVAAHFALTKFFAPLVRLRSGFLLPGATPTQTDGGVGHLTSLSLGFRFRPRGLAHPEEPSVASCIWAELAAAVSAYNGHAAPSFEVAIGFGFLVDDVTMGPVARYQHVMTTAPAEGPDASLMTIGLELLFNDAR